MKLKCPLCLKPLDHTQKLARYCSDHPDQAEDFHCTDENLQSRIFCPAANCNLNGEVGFPGVFIRHVNCEARNPFQGVTDRLTIPGEENTRESEYVGGGEGPRKFTHWEIALLRKAPSEQEMWFPLMLLRAAGEKRDGKRIGVLVELAGAKEVGKTVIAMQAMDKQGYVPPQIKDRSVILNDYLYSRIKVGESPANSAFMAALCLRSLHRNNETNLFKLGGTARGSGVLKTVFIRPADHSRFHQNKPASAKKPTSRWKKFWNEFIIPLWQMIIWKPDSSGPIINSPFWYTVAFYDSAGEDIELWDNSLDEIEKGVDKVAMLINAADIFNSGNGKSLQIAKERIPELRRKGEGNFSLVVTRMDEILETLSDSDQQEVKDLVNNFDSGDRQKERARNLLLRWLEDFNNEGLDFSKRELRDYIETDSIPVFLVWTDGLSSNGDTSQQPVSHGLAQLICWCLDIEWQQINQKPLL